MVGLLKIWEERHIYTADFIDKIKDGAKLPPCLDGPHRQPSITYHLRGVATYIQRMERTRKLIAEHEDKIKQYLQDAEKRPELEKEVQRYERALVDIKATRRYLLIILGNLGRTYRVEHLQRLNKIVETEKQITTIDKYLDEAMEVD